MSTQTKSSGGGGGRNKSKSKSANATTNSVHSEVNKKNADHTKTEKEKTHIKPTAEQIRIAQITDIKSNVEDPKIREKVDQLMETTQRSEEDVCYALYECDNDVEKAVIYLLETLEVGAFATTSKKKKNRAVSSANDSNAAGGGGSTEEWDETNNTGTATTNNTNSNHNNTNISNNRDRSRGRGGLRGSGRGRPRDNNNVDGTRSGNEKGGEASRGGRGRGVGGRGGYGGGTRGGRGGRIGGRTSNYRDNQNYRNNYRQDNQEIDSWDSTNLSADIPTSKNEDTWGDWDNEEYTGSLSDTKVFTPSTANPGSVSNPNELSAPPGLEQQILNPPSQNDVVQQYSSTVVGSSATTASANNSNSNVQYPELHSSSTAAQHLRQALEMPQLNQTTSLSAEQSQYFNTLSSQNTNMNSYPSSAVQYGQYGDHQVSNQQAPVRRQRARVPPPSKIPSTAVEMPGDLNSIGFLDVQFGGLDVQFGTEESFESVADKFSATSIDGSHSVQQSNDVSDYQTKQANSGVSKSSNQSALAAGLQPSQLMQNADSITSNQNDNLTSNYVQRNAGTTNGGSSLDQLGKSDPYIQTSNQTSATNYQNLSYTPSANKASSYQSSATQVYSNNSNYSSAQQQVSTNNYPPSSNTYSGYNQNSYQSQNPSQSNQQQQQQTQQQSQQQSQSSLSSGTTGVNQSGVTGSSTNSSIPVNNAGANSNSNSNYLSNQTGYQSVSQSQYGSQPSSYQSNTVYGSTGLSNNTGRYSGSTNSAAVPYSNFNSSKLKDTPVSSSAYDGTSSNVASNVTSAVSNNSAITTSSISSPSSLGLTNTKATTNSSIKSGSGGSVSSGASGASGSGANSNVVQNIPVVSQFIQTAGVPFYQQQYVQYEDIQLVQPRMTHMPGYYDLNYQTPTSLGAGVRDGTTGNLGTVAYSTMTDGRFARTDNNSSPVSNVPSTISQQTASGGPMLNIPPYTTVPYFYGANMMPGGFQQAYPQIYPQQMATANPTSGGQYAKPSSYSYGSTGYDTAQEYSKTAYQSAGVGVNQQAKGQNVSNQSAGNSDISSSMYSKSHVALNKVNSYDKQSFHSGTPPPFNLAGVNSQTAGVNSQTQAYGQHLFIPAAMTAHHNIGIHHQMQIDGSSRIPNSSRRDTNNTGQRQQSTTQSKTGSKTGYSQSYWATQN